MNNQQAVYTDKSTEPNADSGDTSFLDELDAAESSREQVNADIRNAFATSLTAFKTAAEQAQTAGTLDAFREHGKESFLRETATAFAKLSKEDRAYQMGPVKPVLKHSKTTVREWDAIVAAQDEAAQRALDDALAERTIGETRDALRTHAPRMVEDNYEDDFNRPVVYANVYNPAKDRLAKLPSHRVATEVMTHLQAAEDINLYRRGGQLGMLREVDEDGSWGLEMLNDTSVHGVIERGVALVRHAWHGSGEQRRIITEEIVPPPPSIGTDILNHQDYRHVKPLRCILTHPYLSQGVLHNETGYNHETGIYYPESTACPLILPDSTDEAIALLRETLNEFPFTGEADFENALGLMLTPIIRHDLDALPPLFSITAGKAGSGKSYLAKCLIAPAAGREPSVMNLAHSREELRKELFSVLMKSHPYAIVDNVDPKKPLDSGELASYITERFHEQRVLFKQATAKVENRCTFVYTGNNVETTTELVDRSVQIKLVTAVKRVADRDFDCDILATQILPERGVYLGALYKLVQDWLDNGAPLDVDARHRQRDWAQTIGGILRTAGLGSHFLTNDAEMRRASNPEEVTLGNALHAIAWALGYERVTSDEGFTIKDIFEICSYTNAYYEDGKHNPESGDDMLGEFFKDARDNTQRAANLGRYLRQQNEKTFSSGWKFIVLPGRKKNAKRYRLIDCGVSPDSIRTSDEADAEAEVNATPHKTTSEDYLATASL